MALQIMKALLCSKNAKKGFIFLRLPEVPQFEGRPVSSFDADTG
jgi:hypothetical protein